MRSELHDMIMNECVWFITNGMCEQKRGCWGIGLGLYVSLRRKERGTERRRTRERREIEQQTCLKEKMEPGDVVLVIDILSGITSVSGPDLE